MEHRFWIELSAYSFNKILCFTSNQSSECLFKHQIPSMSSCLVMKPMKTVFLCSRAVSTWWFDCSYWYPFHCFWTLQSARKHPGTASLLPLGSCSSFYTLRQSLGFKAINTDSNTSFWTLGEENNPLLNSRVCRCWWVPLHALCSPLNSHTAFVCSRSHWSREFRQSAHLVASYLPLQPETEDF